MISKVLTIVLIIAIPLSLLASEKTEEASQYLAMGKMSLDKGDCKTAIEHLTNSIEKLPQLADYALYWRAICYDRLDEKERAYEDVKAIKERYKDSPIIKQAKAREIELLKLLNKEKLIQAFEAYLKDYPSDYSMKFNYGQYLMTIGDNQKAKGLFREVFINVDNSLSNKALKELGGEKAITVDDLIKRGNRLNKSWNFIEAERCFKEAMKRDKKTSQRSVIKEGLAYSYFRQKRYKEAMDLYKEIGSTYWYARSLIRAREITVFEAHLDRFLKSNDKRMLQVLIAYSNIKRRNENLQEALSVLNTLLKNYKDKSEQEIILWTIGWTHYLTRDYEKALPIFLKLYDQTKESKYLYWSNRCKEYTSTQKQDRIDNIPVGYRDFYGYLTTFRNNNVIKTSIKALHNQSIPKPLVRAEILFKIGLKNEAINEAVHAVRVSGDNIKVQSSSYFLQKIGNFRYSVNIISRTPYSEDNHSLLYPLAYFDEVQESAKNNELDPFLILAVIREESRYDAEAKSIAGALGLMQLMPNTAKRYEKIAKVNFSNNSELYNPKINISIGSTYLRHLINHFGSLPPAIASYNAGEDAVREWLNKGNYKSIDEFIEDIPYDETNNYVKKVLTTYFEYLKFREIVNPDLRLLGLKIDKAFIEPTQQSTLN
ncbi:MAG: DUF3808 domain-containing protein [Thermodesulfovibrionales bacterium]|nr:DUF3808 domain-containing protein [Thermodesulfovibrionales bacterium]